MSPRAGLDHAKVLAAAMELVEQDGPAGLTVARLSACLQVRPPSLYNHMRSLEQLQNDLAVYGLREVAASMRNAAIGLAGFDALTAMAGAYRNFAREHPGLYAMTVHARERDADYAAASQEVLEIVMAVLRGYDLTGEKALHATRCLRSTIHGFVSLESAGGFGLPLDLDESFRRLICILDHGLRCDFC